MNTQDIGDYIRAKRKSSGWSQEQFAERLDVSTKTVSNWENGEFTSIKNENLEKLSAVFGVSIGEIYAGKDIVGLSDDDKLRIDQTIKTSMKEWTTFKLLRLRLKIAAFFQWKLDVMPLDLLPLPWQWHVGQHFPKPLYSELYA